MQTMLDRLGADDGATGITLEDLVGAARPTSARWGLPALARQRVRGGVTLFHEAAPASSLYQVHAGDFKLVHTEADGYEQVLEFAGHGDLIGADGLENRVHGCTAIALCDATVIVVPAGDVAPLRRLDPAFDARVRDALGSHYRRLGEMAWLMAAVGADRRTARFLLLLSRRMAARGLSPRRLRLTMRRRDIASHLGLAHESVTRSLSAMADAGLLRVDLREIEIVDLDRLEAFARNTRCAHDPDSGNVPRTAMRFARVDAVC